MRIILIQQVLLKGNPSTCRTIQKTIESNIIPHKGDKISDSVFQDPYECEVVEVIINYDNDECYVELPCVELNDGNEDSIEKHLKMAKLHKWDCSV